MQESDRIWKIKKQFFLKRILLEKNCPRGPSIFLEKNYDKGTILESWQEF
jgi:hypothetical protein